MNTRPTYTRDEVYEATLAYFKNDVLATNVWINKYMLKDELGNLYEKTPADMHRRISKELARIEFKYPNPMSEDEIFDLLKDFKYIVPQGSPMSGIGNDFQTVSLSNCYVVANDFDSYGNILKVDQEIVQLSKRRGGVGTDMTAIRPKGTIVKNSALTSTGVVPFMERFSNSIREVAQCIAKGEQVLTERGLINIEEVTKDDKVLTKIGFVKVLDVLKSNKKVYRLETNRGYSIKTSKDHIFVDGDNNEKALKDFNIGDKISLIVGENKITREISLINSDYIFKRVQDEGRYKEKFDNFKIPKTLTEDLAYLVGFSYGDGCVLYDRFNETEALQLSVEHKRPLLKEKIENIVKNYELTYNIKQGDGAVDVITICKKFTLFLDENQILKQKAGDIIFPDKIKKSPENIQLAFIAGYFDADGDNAGKKAGYRFRSINNQFLKDVQSILLMNGIVSNISVQHRNKNLKEKNWLDIYTLAIVGGYSQKRFLNIITNKSIKVLENPHISKIDKIITPFNPNYLGFKSCKYNFIAGNINKISIKAFGQLNVEDKNNIIYPLFTDKIISIEKCEITDTYDLVLEKEHLFYCSGFQVHNSGRRGALLESISIKHPDAEDFIDAKLEHGKITGANISVKITDEFMDCVINNKPYIQQFPVDSDKPSVVKEIDANKLWNKIIKNSWISGEPGVLFIDTIIRESLPDCYEKFHTLTTNPCFVGDTSIKIWNNSIENPKSVEITIYELLKKFNDGEIIYALSYNIEKDVLEYQKIINVIKTKEDADVISIKIKNRFVEVENLNTADHKYFTQNRGYIESKDLTENDVLLFSTEYTDTEINEIYEQEKIKSIQINTVDKKYDVYDLTVENNHNFFANNVLVKNCGEIPLSDKDSCRLLLINLYSYVDNPFTKDATFNYEKFHTHCIIGQRFMDDIVDLEIEKLHKILEKIESDPEPEFVKSVELNLWKGILESAVNGRRCGFGITAEGDMIAAMGLRYGTPEATSFAVDVHKRMAISTHMSSSIMAKERGTFPVYDYDKEKNNPYINRLFTASPELSKMIQTNGRRNIACSTIAPAGSVSIMTQTSSGIEPVFMIYYKRRRKINPSDKNARIDFKDEMGDCWEEYNVFHPKFLKWLKVNDYDVNLVKTYSGEQLNKIIELSPYYKATSADVNWEEKVKMQAECNKYICHSISNTVNLPKDTSVELVDTLYKTAYLLGCKGLTVYRDGSRDGIMSSIETKIDKKDIEKLLKENNAPKRPDILECDVIRFTNKGEKWIGFVSFYEGQLYEIFTGILESFPVPPKVEKGQIMKVKDGDVKRYNFIYKDRDGFNVTMEGISRVFNEAYWDYAKLISALLRHSVHLPSVINILDSLRMDGDLLGTWKAGIRRILKSYIKEEHILQLNKESEEIKEFDKTTGMAKCPKCGEFTYQITGGCPQCVNDTCGYGKCSS